MKRAPNRRPRLSRTQTALLSLAAWLVVGVVLLVGVTMPPALKKDGSGGAVAAAAEAEALAASESPSTRGAAAAGGIRK
jgi:uncharacterized protein (UPF0333 family)